MPTFYVDADDPSQPRPLIFHPGSPATPQEGGSIAVAGQERDFITYRDLDIRNPDLPEASDVAIVWLLIRWSWSTTSTGGTPYPVAAAAAQDRVDAARVAQHR